jgi:hypothetical protein
VVTGQPFRPGPIPPRRDGVPRPIVPTGEILNAIGEDLRNRLGGYVQREEIIRSLRWARNQRRSSAARWSGVRPRVKAPGRGAPTSPGCAAAPCASRRPGEGLLALPERLSEIPVRCPKCGGAVEHLPEVDRIWRHCAACGWDDWLMNQDTFRALP